ncbi:MAG: hypothetical protein ACXW2X_10070, partial [Thermoanaerobaculia bacterium]
KIVGIDWGMAQAVGGIKLVVEEQNLDAAREILGGALESPHEPIARWRDVAPPAACPECGSPHLEPVPRLRIFLFIAAAFIGIGVAAGQSLLALTGLIAVAAGALMMPSSRCTACQHRFTPPPRSEEHVEAPLPDERDTIEVPCPRCGSLEVYGIDRRRLKAIPLLFNPAILLAVPLWLLGPKRRCESCGLRM